MNIQLKSFLIIFLVVFTVCFMISCNDKSDPASAAQNASGELPAYAIVNVTVIPMDTDQVLKHQTVLVHDGKIVSIAPLKETTIPKEAMLIDGSYRYLIPGLFDMHIHINNESELTPYLPFGITTVLSNHGSEDHLKIRERIKQGALLAPRFFTSGPTVSTVGIETVEEAERLVRDQKAAGYDFIKMYGDLSREAYSKLIQTANELGMHVGGHAPRNLPFEAVLSEGQDSIAHLEEILYTVPAIVDVIKSYRDKDDLKNLPDLRPILSDVIKQLAGRIKESGLTVIPTLSGYEMIWQQTTDQLIELQESRQIAYVAPMKRFNFRPEQNRYRTRNQFLNWDHELQRSLELQMLMLKEFHDAGVPICAGTDAGLPVNFPGSGLHRELELYVESGLSTFEALQAATTAPAKMLKIDDEVGTITVGKRADLVLLDGNPLDNTQNTKKIFGVFTNGRWLPKKRLDTMLRELADGYKNTYGEMLKIDEILKSDGVDEAVAHFNSLVTRDDQIAVMLRRAINSEGYRFLNEEKFEEAIRVFQINTREFPDSANSWDSLAEAHLKNGDRAVAIELYNKALEVDPNFNNAKNMLRSLKEGGQ